MRIGGMVPSSFIDYPEHIAAVIFTVGCNMNCFYCHNKRLIGAVPDSELMPESQVMEFLKKRVGLLDGVVISGGEPTLQKDLADFIRKVRALDFHVKLDTNGGRPDVLRELLTDGLLDYVAMDIKAPFARYAEFSGTPLLTEKVKESIELLNQSGIRHMFRTTMAAGLTERDAEEIRAYLPDGTVYITQEYREPKHQ